jgi:hypothetical protein
MKILFLLLFFVFQISVYTESDFNPWNLKIFERLIHRKNVSHLLIDPREDHYRVVLILSDRFPYNYKSRQYGFYIKAENEIEANQIMNSFDKQLQSGFQIYLKLNGSRVIDYKFLDRE